MSDLTDALLQACRETPDWDRVSRQHWVMDLSWYKRIRREFSIPDDPEPDEEKWAPDPHDTLFGYPMEVREDGGKPHLEIMAAPNQRPTAAASIPPAHGNDPSDSPTSTAPAPGGVPASCLAATTRDPRPRPHATETSIPVNTSEPTAIPHLEPSAPLPEGRVHGLAAQARQAITREDTHDT